MHAYHRHRFARATAHSGTSDRSNLLHIALIRRWILDVVAGAPVCRFPDWSDEATVTWISVAALALECVGDCRATFVILGAIIGWGAWRDAALDVGRLVRVSVGVR
jgi:hypothetical protein